MLAAHGIPERSGGFPADNKRCLEGRAPKHGDRVCSHDAESRLMDKSLRQPSSTFPRSGLRPDRLPRGSMRVGTRAAVVLCAVWFPCGCVAVRGALVDPIRRTMARQYVNEGERLLNWSRPREARAAFRRAVEADPQNASAHGRLGELLARDCQYEQAAEEYRLALRSNPNNLDYALGLGDSLRQSAETSMHRSQDYAAAIRAYRHARSLQADNVRAAVGLGISLDQIGDHRLAVDPGIISSEP